MTIHLSIVMWLPAAFALAGAMAGPRLAPRAALGGAALTLAYAIVLLVDFDPDADGLQYVTDETWISQLGIHYKLGVDGLSLFLIALTALLFFSAILACNLREWERPRLFYFLLALGESAVLGAFMAQDLILFVVFFDLMLIPFYFLIGVWGERDRVRATTKLVIYTLVGSLLMLAAAIATGVLMKPDGGDVTFVLSELQALPLLEESSQDWIFLCFVAAFLVKMPSFPVHGWLPDGYRAMPIPVLVVFSAVLSKVAAYGFLRVALPLFPDAAVQFQLYLLILATISIVYGSAMAFTTTDARLVVGYSSIAQLGFITLGIFAFKDEGAQGAVLQMVNHGLVVAPLFFIIALLAARAGGSEDIRDMGGLAFRAPILAALFLITAFATLAMPGSANFVGEFLILLGVFKAEMAIAFVAAVGVVLASVYMLRAFIRTMHNRVAPEAESREIGWKDGLVVAPLVALIIAFGVYPQLALDRGEKGVVSAIGAPKAIKDPPPPQQAAQQQAPVELPPGVTIEPGTGGAPAP